jgi:hypothetical protein
VLHLWEVRTHRCELQEQRQCFWDEWCARKGRNCTGSGGVLVLKVRAPFASDYRSISLVSTCLSAHICVIFYVFQLWTCFRCDVFALKCVFACIGSVPLYWMCSCGSDLMCSVCMLALCCNGWCVRLGCVPHVWLGLSSPALCCGCVPLGFLLVFLSLGFA